MFWSFSVHYFITATTDFLQKCHGFHVFIFITDMVNLSLWTETIGGIMILLFLYWDTCTEIYQKTPTPQLHLAGATQNTRVVLLVGMIKETLLRKMFLWLSLTRLWSETSQAKLRRLWRSALLLASRCKASDITASSHSARSLWHMLRWAFHASVDAVNASNDVIGIVY